MWESWVRPLGWEDPLEKDMATPVFLLENPMDRGAWWATVPEIAKSQTEQVKTAHNLSRSYPVLQGIHCYHMEHTFFLPVHPRVKLSCSHHMYTRS